MKNILLPKLLSLILSIIITLLSIAFVMGWHLDQSITPYNINIPYSTSIAFLLTGLGFFVSLKDKRKIAALIGILIIIMAMLTFSQYLFGGAWGIDKQLMKRSYNAGEANYQNRTSPISAVCFLLTGITLVILNLQSHMTKHFHYISILGGLILIIATLSGLAYYTRIDDIYSFFRLYKMGIYTSAIFMLVGITILTGFWFPSYGKTWINATIYRKMMFLILVPASLLWCFVVTYSIYRINQSTEQETHHQLREISWKNTNILETELNIIEDKTRSTRRSLLKQATLSEEMLKEAIEQNLSINKIVSSSSIIFAPYAYTQDQKLFSPTVVRDSNNITFPAPNEAILHYSKKIWKQYSIPESENRALWSSPYRDSRCGKSWITTFSVPVMKDQKLWMGITIDIRLDRISELLVTEKLDKFSYAIINSEGDYIYSSKGPQRLGSNILDHIKKSDLDKEDYTTLVNDIRKKEYGTKAMTSSSGDIIRTIYNPIGDSGWTFLISVPESEMFVHIGELHIKMGLIMSAILLTLILIISYIAKQITRPISKLNEAAKQIAEGDFSTPNSISSDDELGILSQNFSIMTSQLLIRENKLVNFSNELVKTINEKTVQLKETLEKTITTQEIKRESEQRFKSLFESSPIPRCHCRKDGVVLSLNNEFTEVYGYTLEDIPDLASWWPKAFPDPNYRKATQERIIEQLRIAQENNTLFETQEFNIRCKNGETKSVLGGASILKDSYLLTLFDNTARKKEELKAKVEQAQLRSYLDLSPISVVITHLDGSIKYVNKRFFNTFGLKAGDSIVKIHVHKKNRDIVLSYLKNHKRITNHQLQYYTKDKVILDAILSTNSITYEGQKAFLNWIVDISQLKNTEKQLKEAIKEVNLVNDGLAQEIESRIKTQEQLKRAKQQADQANQSKSLFLANMSHEIRTPMNAILGFSELLEEIVVSELEQSYVKSIRLSGKSLLTLINDILDLSKVEAGKISLNYDYFDLRSTMAELKSIFSLSVKEKALNFLLDIDPNMPKCIYTDETRFKQIMINLIGNALKFTSKGHIKVSIKSVANDKDQSVNLAISVEDTGIGISQKFRKELFESFTQQDSNITKKYGGTGLGLTISKKLAKLMNGDIQVESKEGEGSVFTLSLNKVKYHKDQNNKEDYETNDTNKVKFKAVKILLVDDVEDNRKYTSMALKNHDITIFEADNGKAALKLLEKNDVDLILTDLWMPQMDGFTMVKKIKENSKYESIPIIATSSSVIEFNEHKGKENRFDIFLAKPFSVQDLVNSLAKLLPSKVEIITEKKPETTREKLKIKKDQQEHFYTSIKELVSESEPLKEQQASDDVNAFASKVSAVGKQFNVQSLIDYGEAIKTSLTNFDIETLINLINNFSKTVNSLIDDLENEKTKK